jgi:AcrR family transcriptional regulator
MEADSTTTATPAPRRGRPRAFDRKSALAQATRLFWEKGFEATSMADLTAAMGIGSPSLYAAFGSKEALYAEALGHYRDTYETLVWSNFFSKDDVREAFACWLHDSAGALTGCLADIPRGCMVTLSAVGSEGYAELGELVRSARGITLARLDARLQRAVDEGQIPAAVDVHALARFMQTVQGGMSIQARDGAHCAELDAVAQVAMMAFDARIAA